MKSRTFLLLAILVQVLSASCLDKTTDIEVGECYEKEGNTNLAQAAYERVLIEDEDNLIARLKLAQLYNDLAMPAQANELVVNVNEAQLTPAQRTSLAAVRTSPTQTLNTFHTKISLNLGYDTNINVTPSEATLSDLNSSLKNASATLFSRLQADLSYLHDLGSSGGWFLRTDANLFYQDNASAHDYDVTYGRVYAGGGYRTGSLSFYLPLFYDRMHYLNEDLLQEHGVRPDLTFQFSPKYIVNINVSYTQRHYIQASDQLRNDDIIGAGAGLFWLGTQHMAYVKTRYENFTATDGNAPVFTNKALLYATLGGVYTIASMVNLRLDYQYRNGNFEKKADIKRDDSNHDVKVGIEHDITQHLRLNANYRYITNSSSYALAEYDKHETLLGIAYNY